MSKLNKTDREVYSRLLKQVESRINGGKPHFGDAKLAKYYRTLLEDCE